MIKKNLANHCKDLFINPAAIIVTRVLSRDIRIYAN